MIAEILGWVATLFRGAGMLAKKANKVKYLVSIGNLFWMLNGIFTSNVPLIVSNGFCLLVMLYEIIKQKKGEKQILANSCKTCKEEQRERKENCNEEDKPEPKFKVGDWITNKGHSYLIASIDYEQGRYLFEIGGYTHEQLNWEYIYSADEKYHLWTIADAKPGDVLISQYNKPFIYNGNHNHSHIGFYCGISVEDRINVSSIRCCCWTENVNIHPATKVQRELLFRKMRENGYYWNRDTKTIAKH